ncbi:MAG: Phage-related baseplate assembly protein [Methanocella sp. PtaU1.Bin125]|nr:MAG: Phage-related baseplate assembly protein [Methanocella sp. PtaU1.Bin125]
MPADNEGSVAEPGGRSGGSATGQSDGSEGLSMVGAMKKIAESETKKLRTFDLGLVTSVFPHASASDNENYYCSVKLRDSDADELRNVPIMTSHIGLAYVPNIGDLVLIGYIGGNVNSPVVLGSLYNDEQRPPVNKAGEIVYESPDSEDSSGSLRRVHLKFPSGMEITITDKEASIKHKDTSIHMTTEGNMYIGTEKKFAFTGYGDSGNLKVGGSGDVKLFSEKQKVVVESKSADVVIKAAAGLSIQCGGELKLKAATITIKSDANTEITAGANMSVKGGAVTEIKGSLVNIN